MPATVKKPTDMLRLVTGMLRIYGLHPEQKGFLPSFLFFITLVSATVNIVLMLMEMAFHWEGMPTLERLDLFPASAMFLVKAIAMRFLRPHLARLLKTLSMVWPTSQFDQATEESGDKVYALVRKLMIGYIIIGMFNGALLMLLIFLSGEHTLIYKGYDVCDYARNTPCWALMMVWQIILFLQAVPMVVAFDYVFLSATTYLYVGAILLQTAFRKLALTLSQGDRTVRQNLKQIVDQHNVLLRIIPEVDEYCSFVMSVQFLASLASLIFCLYAFNADGMPPNQSNIKYIFLYNLFATQLLIYSLAGTLFYNKFQNLVNHVYDVDWYNADRTSLGKDLSFIILRIQTMQAMRLSKMVDLNLNLYVQILKTSFSIYTLLKNL